MLPEPGTPLFASHGHALHELFIKTATQAYTQWGYLVSHPDQSYSIFKDKVSALQCIDRSLNTQGAAPPEPSPGELILQEDMTSSPSTSSLITTD